MATGFDVPFVAYNMGTELTKIACFIGAEVGVVLIAVAYKLLVVNKSTLGPTDEQLVRTSQEREPEVWEAYGRAHRAYRRSLSRPFASFSIARPGESSSNETDQAGSSGTATESEDAPIRSRRSVVRSVDNMGPLPEHAEEEEEEEEGEEDASIDPKMSEKRSIKLVQPHITAQDSTLESANGAETITKGLSNEDEEYGPKPTIPTRSSSRRTSLIQPEMAEAFPPLTQLQSQARWSGLSALEREMDEGLNGQRGHSPSSIVRMYAEEFADAREQQETVAEAREIDTQEVERSRPRKKGLRKTQSHPGHFEQIASSSPIDKYGRRGRESVAPEELKRNGLFNKVRRSVNRKASDDAYGESD